MERAVTLMTRLEYLAEINRRLMEHPDYVPGMEFIFSPPGSAPDEATGFAWVPPETVEPMRSIATAVYGEIEVIAPYLEAEPAILS